MKKVKSIVDVKPVMSQVLVEMLTAQEAMNTILTVKEDSDYGAPQGYVLAMGPSAKPEEMGFKVGDRVVLQGSFVPLPNYDGHSRQRGVLEPHNIKAVLVEDQED